MLAAFVAIIMGSLGVFYPGFFHKSELLTPQQIERNKCIWNRGGIVLLVGGLILLAMRLFWK
jgi:hypothetical protein